MNSPLAETDKAAIDRLWRRVCVADRAQSRLNTIHAYWWGSRKWKRGYEVDRRRQRMVEIESVRYAEYIAAAMRARYYPHNQRGSNNGAERE